MFLKQLTDITEVICTGLGRRGTVCPLGRCLTKGYELVGELLKITEYIYFFNTFFLQVLIVPNLRSRC